MAVWQRPDETRYMMFRPDEYARQAYIPARESNLGSLNIGPGIEKEAASLQWILNCSHQPVYVDRKDIWEVQANVTATKMVAPLPAEQESESEEETDIVKSAKEALGLLLADTTGETTSRLMSAVQCIDELSADSKYEGRENRRLRHQLELKEAALKAALEAAAVRQTEAEKQVVAWQQLAVKMKKRPRDD